MKTKKYTMICNQSTYKKLKSDWNYSGVRFIVWPNLPKPIVCSNYHFNKALKTLDGKYTGSFIVAMMGGGW